MVTIREGYSSNGSSARGIASSSMRQQLLRERVSKMSGSWPDSAGTSIGKLLTTLRAVDQPAGTTDTPSPLKTPYSLQDIKSGATTLTKLWAVAVAAAGGAPAVWAIIEGLANSVGGSKSDVPLVRAAFVISGAVLLSAVSIAIAIIVRGDVAARAA